ncbi:MAG: hypothetical protein ABL901_20810 [Hyphomicrobiaceae bacterium]
MFARYPAGMDDNARAAEPSAASLAMVAAILTPVGAAMLLYGLDLVSLDVMRPNRHLPRVLFTLIGIFTLAAAALAALRAVNAPKPVIDGLGWSTVGLSFVILTAMAFDTTGSGSCAIGSLPIIGGLGQSACSLCFQALAVLIDAAAVALAASWAHKSLRQSFQPSPPAAPHP